MCGIIGYIGPKNDPRVGLEALKRLEYRGYDSAGYAVVSSGGEKIYRQRTVGGVDNLKTAFENSPVPGSPFILHTRWATHGEPSEKNAHPHNDCSSSFYVVHNGIIENHTTLRNWLKERNHNFNSETDTEVLAHLIEEGYSDNLASAVENALKKISGTYGLLVVSKYDPDTLIAARFGSPLLVGIGNDEYFVSSDPAGVLAHTKQVVYLKDNEIAKLSGKDMEIISSDGKKTPEVEEIEWNLEDVQKGGYPHFMLKEINEQPSAVSGTIRGRTVVKEGNVKLGGLDISENTLSKIKKIHIVACGTAYHAGLVGKYMLEEYGGIPTEVSIGSEFRYKRQLLDDKTAVLAISQSGETADVLASLHEAKNKGAATLGIVNVVGSSIARETDAGIYNHAGPEIGVASTKAYTSQLTTLALLSVYLGRKRDMSYTMGKRIVEETEKLPDYINNILSHSQDIQKIAEKYKSSSNMVYVGRKYNYPTALEGALKLKEISYLHAEGYAGGELKHGPLALIDKNFPVFSVMPKDSVYEKMNSNVEEVKARGGAVIILTTEGNEEAKSFTDDVIYIPKTLEMLTPVLATIPTQLFAYYVGVARGYNVDKPRNLAKSVTVE